MSIKLPYSNTKTISIRLENSFINEIESVSKNTSELLKTNISRNLLIELMLQYAREHAKFDVDGMEKSFDDLLSIQEGEHASIITDIHSDN